MVSSVTMLAGYGMFVLWTCVICPFGRVTWFVCRYLGGKAPWAASTDTDEPSPSPNWCGPGAPRLWTSLYVQKEVRGRSVDQRLPHDLLICHEGAYARLRHGPLKGRTNRKGFSCAYDEVIGCTSRSLRRKLETEPLQVHLCSADPCLDADLPGVHIVSSAAVPRTSEYDLQEMAGRGPWSRAWRVLVWGSRTLASIDWLRHVGSRRLAQRQRPELDPNSETDTDPDDHPCQAHLVALAVPGGIVALSECPCSDAARGEPISLLLEDADRSATGELGGSRPRYTFGGCPTHRNAYMASRATRACARVGCHRSKSHVREGIPLCDEHSKPAVTWHDEPPVTAPPRSRSPSPGRIAPLPAAPEDSLHAPARAWIRWSEPGDAAEHAYYSFAFQLMGRAVDSTRQNPRTSIYLPDLDLTFSVPSDLAAGGINLGQAEQMALSRAPVIVDPPWGGHHGHNQHGDPLPYSAAQSLNRGSYPEGYAVHHLGRILPDDEQPQPRSTTGEPPIEPGMSGPSTPRLRRTVSQQSDTPGGFAATPSPDLGLLGDYISARLSGRTAQDALEACANGGQATGDVRLSLSHAATWYQDQHPAPRDPAAAAALQELLDPVARLRALGDQKNAVTPPSSPGRPRSASPAARGAAAMFLGPTMGALSGRGRVSAFDSVAAATRAARPPSLMVAPSPLAPRGDSGTSGSRDHYAGAYSDPPVDRGPGDAPDANTRALQSIARSLNEREDANTQERGKVGSIGKVEERCVYYARACDNFHVALCSGVLGRTAFNALRNVASQGRSLMKTLQFPVNLTNRIAYGMASLSIGGRCHQSAAEWSLGAGDFPQTSEEQFDAYRPSSGSALERKPRHATTLLAWHRDALRMSWALACFYGEEWYAQWEEAAHYLLKLGEQHEYAWPAESIFGVWAELWNRWCEELREIDRSVLRELREEAPSYDRIRFFLTTPGTDGTPWLRPSRAKPAQRLPHRQAVTPRPSRKGQDGTLRLSVTPPLLPPRPPGPGVAPLPRQESHSGHSSDRP